MPGADKITLVENSSPADAAAFDGFAAALRDGGYRPARFTAADVRPSDSRPGAVLATLTVAAPDAAQTAQRAPFSFPLEFRSAPAGWQLTRDSAAMLLNLG